VCENWPHADVALSDALVGAGADAGSFACVPASVERMVRGVPDSLDLIGENLESLYFSARGWRGPLPDLDGLDACEDLGPYYARKLFTNNAGHAVLAYEGHLAGRELLCEALAEPAIRRRVEEHLSLSAEMLTREYGMEGSDLAEHVRVLIGHRFANRELADTVRRVARSPLRKLGPEERLTGLLRKLAAHGLATEPVCRTIAAAMHYDDPDDAECERMKEMIRRGGPGRVLAEVCGLDPAGPLHRECLNQWRAIEARVSRRGHRARKGDVP
jgi:mannitol-1-phosphate 5-dehydrogenase